MKVVLLDQVFDPFQALSEYQNTYIPAGKHGGSCNFIGNMRDFNDGHDGISVMYLDHYPGMTEKHIEQVCQDAMDRWDIIDCCVVHRYGEIKPNEAIVLVGVWSEHRAQAFDACRFIINDLKHRAPFWKRETTPDGARWVEHNTKDEVADKVAGRTGSGG